MVVAKGRWKQGDVDAQRQVGGILAEKGRWRCLSLGLF